MLLHTQLRRVRRACPHHPPASSMLRARLLLHGLYVHNGSLLHWRRKGDLAEGVWLRIF